MASNTTFAKRQKERARQEKQRAKDAKRKQRRAEGPADQGPVDGRDAKGTKPVVVAPPAPDARQLLNEARAALALKQLDRAANQVHQRARHRPDEPCRPVQPGAIRYQQNRYDEAEDYLRKAVAEAPNDAETRSLLGVVFYLARD